MAPPLRVEPGLADQTRRKIDADEVPVPLVMKAEGRPSCAAAEIQDAAFGGQMFPEDRPFALPEADPADRAGIAPDGLGVGIGLQRELLADFHCLACCQASLISLKVPAASASFLR